MERMEKSEKERMEKSEKEWVWKGWFVKLVVGLEGLVCEIGGGFELDFHGGVWFF